MLADDRVRRGKELRKVEGALRAALKRGDLMEAEQVRKVMTEKFGITDLTDDSASDPEIAEDCDGTSSSTDDSNNNTGTGATSTAPTAMSTTTTVSTSCRTEDEPTLTQVDEQGDSQATLVGDDDDLVEANLHLACPHDQRLHSSRSQTV
eukprot:COSAG02_NODE_1926_length_10341_cov_25.525776_4_plen_150_part_00